MKKTIGLSLVLVSVLQALPIELEEIEVEATIDTEVVKDVYAEELKSADLSEALFKQSPSVSLVRRSGIANDVIIRGQKKDNINVTIDGAKVYGACPNRMDPPISHVLTNNIDYIELNEGPFNVEDFGSLSADVKIHTKKPAKTVSGEFDVNIGSWGYKKGTFSLSGGGESVRFLLSGSKERAKQYKDGDGNNFASHQEKFIATHPTLSSLAYQAKYRDLDAYTKDTLMAKMFWDITEKQRLKLSYTANRSDTVLYPNTPMDALYDDSDIYNMEYEAGDLGKYSKRFTLQMYRSKVNHPMANTYRKSSNVKGIMVHKLDTESSGIKLKNEFDISNHTVTTGADYNVRNWDGSYTKDGEAFPNVNHPNYHSIWDVETKNIAFFMKDKITVERWEINLGLRYDDTKITTARTERENDYSGVSTNLFARYKVDENTLYFSGVGIASRVPDGRELYFHSKGGGAEQIIGTDDLKKVVNHEFDIGIEKHFENLTFKAKTFYSYLKDYIAYNATKKMRRFENVDATIWGFEFSGSYIMSDEIYMDYGIAYQRGRKKDPLEGETDRDLAEIPPLKLNLALNYAYDENTLFKADLIVSDKWRDFDADNGEQALDSYNIVNLMITKMFTGNIEVTLGVDNLFDKTFALSNTYKDLTLISGGGVDEVMLLNEPGRYVYTNIKYTF